MTKRIEALSRGLQVLDVLRAEGPLGLTQAAALTGLPKATLLRILATLEAGGYARRGLGDRLWRAASQRRQEVDDGPGALVADRAGPVLDALCQKVLWPSDVGIYREGAIRVLETSRRVSPFLVNRDVMHMRVHVLPSAMGRAILAWSTPERQAQVLETLAESPDLHDWGARDDDATRALLEEARAQGYATRQPGYAVSMTRARVMAIAVPVIADGNPVAAINLCWVASAMNEARFVREHLGHLREAAEEMGQAVAAG